MGIDGVECRWQVNLIFEVCLACRGVRSYFWIATREGKQKLKFIEYESE